MRTSKTILTVSLFAIAFGLVEASVVVYLRQLFYPDGFTFPLKPTLNSILLVEISREFATIVMLAAVGALAGRTRWEKFAWFLIAFGIWDISFYLWLKVFVNWPATLVDWDILFLIPIPWIGPVIAPVLVSIVMIAGGGLILSKSGESSDFRPSGKAIVSTLTGSAVILTSFMLDTDAALRFQPPAPYHYELLVFGLLCYAFAFVGTLRSKT